MAISPRMQALILKIEAADAEHFAMLLERAKRQAAARAKTFEKQRSNLRAARAVQARTAKRKTPPLKKPPLGDAG